MQWPRNDPLTPFHTAEWQQWTLSQNPTTSQICLHLAVSQWRVYSFQYNSSQAEEVIIYLCYCPSLRSQLEMHSNSSAAFHIHSHDTPEGLVIPGTKLHHHLLFTSTAVFWQVRFSSEFIFSCPAPSFGSTTQTSKLKK